jgi:peroxiredoxin
VQSVKPELDRRSVAVAAVSFAEPATLDSYQKHHQWPFPILADPQRAAYRSFDLKRLSWLRVFSPATMKSYWQLLRRGLKREDYGRADIYQSGGDFLLDRNGNILFAHRSEEPSDRPSAAYLLEVIDKLAGPKRKSEN